MQAAAAASSSPARCSASPVWIFMDEAGEIHRRAAGHPIHGQGHGLGAQGEYAPLEMAVGCFQALGQGEALVTGWGRRRPAVGKGAAQQRDGVHEHTRAAAARERGVRFGRTFAGR